MKWRHSTISQSELGSYKQFEDLELGQGAEVEAVALCAQIVVISPPMLPTRGRVTELLGEDVVAEAGRTPARSPGP